MNPHIAVEQNEQSERYERELNIMNENICIGGTLRALEEKDHQPLGGFERRSLPSYVVGVYGPQV